MWSFEYLLKDIVLAKVVVNGNSVSVENFTDDIVDRPFGTNLNPTMADLDDFLEERVFPRERINAKSILKGKLYGYDVLSIIHDTHGILIDDYYWIRFDDEKDLCWDDVKHWKFH